MDIASRCSSPVCFCFNCIILHSSYVSSVQESGIGTFIWTKTIAKPSLRRYPASIPGLSDHEAVAEDLYTCLQWIKKKTKTPLLHIITSQMGRPRYRLKVKLKASEKMDHAGAYLNTVNMHRGVVAWLTSLSRTLLEYRATVWDPCIKQDVDQLEQVQCQTAHFISIILIIIRRRIRNTYMNNT